jgi:hypothetical protein
MTLAQAFKSSPRRALTEELEWAGSKPQGKDVTGCPTSGCPFAPGGRLRPCHTQA